MSYPPQGGGWQQDQPGGWQQDQPGGWQSPQPGGWHDPAGGYPAPSSGQPAYVDPVSGQPTSYPGYPQQYPTSPNYGYGYQPTYPGYTAPMPGAGSRTNGLSIAALVVSLVALFSIPCYGVGGIVIGAVAAVLGHVGKRQITERGEQGGGMALAGIIMGWIAVGVGLIVAGIFAYAIWFVVKNAPVAPTGTPT
jgi:hypothetical protein